MSYFYAGDWMNALVFAQRWLLDEPFSIRPASLTVYICSTILEDYELGLKVSIEGLRANPSDPIMLNNLIFTLVNLNRLEEAKAFMPEGLDQSIYESGVVALLATRGLLAYRLRDPDDGKRLYRMAVMRAIARQNQYEAALAALYCAMEEVLARPEAAEDTIEWAISHAKRVKRPDVELVMNRLLERWEVAKERIL